MIINSSNTRIDFQKISKILIVRLGKIGDLVVTSFVFEIFKNKFPKIEIHLLTLPSNKEVIKYNPNLTKVFYSKKNLSLYFKLFSIRKEKYDMMLDFNDNPSSTSAMLFRYAKARIKAGYDFTKYNRVINFKIKPLRKENTHIIERMKNFLMQLGLHVEENLIKPFFYLGSDVLAEVRTELMPAENQHLIMINLSAGAKIRYWSDEKWISLISLIQANNNNFSIILLSTEEDFIHKEKIATTLKLKIYNQGMFTSIQHFAAYIQCAKLLITPDTSAVHIASAFGIPTIALFPNPEWNFVSWQPYRVANRVIKSSTENVNDISVEEVFSKFKSLINEIGLA